MKKIITLCLFLSTLDVYASLTYYPQDVLKKFNDPNISPQELREILYNTTAKIHVLRPGKQDTLADTCPASAKCVSQRQDLSYTEARQIMFGELFLEDKGNGHYSLKDVYCNKEFNQSQGVGPGSIPDSNVINCEHTWPQSKFSTKFPANLQKTDLHHLFPVDMRANSTRNNHPFAEVDGKPTNSTCRDSQIGKALSDPNVISFEPPAEHKGNVARAIYYFSIRYKMEIPKSEAVYLKTWNAEDPVDDDETHRNERIMELQGNRNPFVDYPGLVNLL